MRKVSVFSILVIASLVLAFPSNLKAQTIYETRKEERLQNRQEFKEEVKTRIKDNSEERKATREARLTVKRQERIKNLWEKIKLRLLALSERLEGLISRISERIEKIEEENPDVNTSEIKAKLASAEEKLNETKNLIQELNVSFENFAGSDTPGKDFEAFRESISLIKNNLKEVHRILVGVIADIKGLRIGNSG